MFKRFKPGLAFNERLRIHFQSMTSSWVRKQIPLEKTDLKFAYWNGRVIHIPDLRFSAYTYLLDYPIEQQFGFYSALSFHEACHSHFKTHEADIQKILRDKPSKYHEFLLFLYNIIEDGRIERLGLQKREGSAIYYHLFRLNFATYKSNWKLFNKSKKSSKLANEKFTHLINQIFTFVKLGKTYLLEYQDDHEKIIIEQAIVIIKPILLDTNPESTIEGTNKIWKLIQPSVPSEESEVKKTMQEFTDILSDYNRQKNKETLVQNKKTEFINEERVEKKDKENDITKTKQMTEEENRLAEDPFFDLVNDFNDEINDLFGKDKQNEPNSEKFTSKLLSWLKDNSKSKNYKFRLRRKRKEKHNSHFSDDIDFQNNRHFDLTKNSVKGSKIRKSSKRFFKKIERKLNLLKNSTNDELEELSNLYYDTLDDNSKLDDNYGLNLYSSESKVFKRFLRQVFTSKKENSEVGYSEIEYDEIMSLELFENTEIIETHETIWIRAHTDEGEEIDEYDNQQNKDIYLTLKPTIKRTVNEFLKLAGIKNSPTAIPGGSQRKSLRSQRTGEIELRGSTLSQFLCGNQYIRKKELPAHININFDLVILIDLTGSMDFDASCGGRHGSRLSLASEAAVVFSETLHILEVDYKLPIRFSVFGYATRDEYTPQMEIIKKFEDKWISRESSLKTLAFYPHGGNCDARALYESIIMLEKLPKKKKQKKLIFFLSDGGGEEIDDATLNKIRDDDPKFPIRGPRPYTDVIRWGKKKNIETYVFMIDESAGEKNILTKGFNLLYSNKFDLITDMNQLAPAFAKRLIETLRIRR